MLTFKIVAAYYQNRGCRGLTIKTTIPCDGNYFYKFLGKGCFAVPSRNSLKSIRLAAANLPMIGFFITINCHHIVPGLYWAPICKLGRLRSKLPHYNRGIPIVNIPFSPAMAWQKSSKIEDDYNKRYTNKPGIPQAAVEPNEPKKIKVFKIYISYCASWCTVQKLRRVLCLNWMPEKGNALPCGR